MHDVQKYYFFEFAVIDDDLSVCAHIEAAIAVRDIDMNRVVFSLWKILTAATVIDAG